ncbi:MAG TPA: DUF4124 domain-containing protein [Steroidobacteraceae bacterium]|jgi:hypothetical protein
MFRKLAITTLVLAAALVGSAQADIYRWKDAQGVFHYSDQWVPGSELIKSNTVRPPGTETSSLARPASSEPGGIAANANSQLQQEQTTRAVQQDVAKAREEQCKKAKEAYDKAVAARRIYKSDKDGEREYMTDAEADAVRVRARTEMDQACGTVTK